MLRLMLAITALLLASAATAETHEVQVFNFRYEPAELTIQAGDTVLWRNMQGTHNVRADDNSFSSGSPASGEWTFQFTFDQAGTFPYFCTLHGGPGGSGMAGRIVVQQTPAPVFEINEGLAGSWFEPATSGSGFLIEFNEAQRIFALAWFTWGDQLGDHDWYVGVGTYQGHTATATLFRSTGGRFNDPTAPVSDTPAGTITFVFDDCMNATATFEITETDPPRTDTLQLLKLLPPGVRCLETSEATISE